MSGHQIGRRGFSAALACSPLALMTARGATQVPRIPDKSPGAFDVPHSTIGKLQRPVAVPFDLAEVRLLPGPCLDAQRANVGYMKRLSLDRLLRAFRLNAGLPSNAVPLGGWEAPDCELRGHFTGHYMSGCALGFRATGDLELRRRGETIVAVLGDCQRRLNQGGYLSAFPLELFDRLDARKDVWAPFYTIHKIMAGLLDMHALAGNGQALTVLVGMARWVDAWTAARSEAHMQDILETEYGGMNDLLYKLAGTTGDPHWISVGDRFTKKRVFNPLADRRDELRGLHMNTHVPQVIGAAARYELSGDSRFGQVAHFFWQTIAEGRSYATGGSSNAEHWLTAPYRLGEEWALSDHHQECCCSYNMLKLTAHLFGWAPRAELMDYYERNLLNHRLGMIDAQTGLSSYFLSMSPGAWKTLGTEDQSFWCCNGTALEEFARLGSMIYGRRGGDVYLNLFIASRLDSPEHGIALRQETDFPAHPSTRLFVERSPGDAWTLHLRIPAWSQGARVRVNGRAIEVVAEAGSYLRIDRRWRSGDRIEVDLPMSLRLEPFPDQPDLAAIVYGPVVLAQQMAEGNIPEAMRHDQGPDLAKAPSAIEPAVLPMDIADRLRPVPTSPLTFVWDGGPQPVVFKPVSESWKRFAAYSRLG